MTKEEIKARLEEIIDLARKFCAAKLDDEYLELSMRLVYKMGRKRTPPFVAGKPEIWAAAVIHALGTINFLFDKSFKPYSTVDEINQFFGTSKSTVTAKSKLIRDMFGLQRFDGEFSTARMAESNPFNKLVMIDGMIAPIEMLTEEEQEIVRAARAAGKDVSFYTT